MQAIVLTRIRTLKWNEGPGPLIFMTQDLAARGHCSKHELVVGGPEHQTCISDQLVGVRVAARRRWIPAVCCEDACDFVPDDSHAHACINPGARDERYVTDGADCRTRRVPRTSNARSERVTRRNTARLGVMARTTPEFRDCIKEALVSVLIPMETAD